MATEQDLETFLECHPYLLAPELARKRSVRQLSKGNSRLDLLFHLRNGHCVVELKKTALSIVDVRQIARYCRLLEKEGRSLSHHYLVGFRPTDLEPV
jgi:RecB family endonuclease NucS